MKKIGSIHIATIIVVLASFFAFNQPVRAQSSEMDQPDYVPDQLVVIYKGGKALGQYGAQTADIASKVGGRAIKAGASGTGLIQIKEGDDLDAVKAKIAQDPAVELVEYNYIYAIPELAGTPDGYKLNSEYVVQRTSETTKKESGKDLQAVAISELKSLKSVRGGVVQATFPNDQYLWNGGWDWVEADIVWPNSTPSAGVCVLDTGVDYLHPDLAGRIIKGFDFVNGDADPMDDFGHGTHVAGIITALPNNKIGMAGASAAKVVAVKVLGAQGWGTSFDIREGIMYCANRTDVKVLNMSLGGSYSEAIDAAIGYAVNVKNKLVVAAAGNSNTDAITYAYPAALSTNYPNKVLAVAASGLIEEFEPGYYFLDYRCKAQYSNYGSWISIVAPGTDIISTTPYDKPFYLNYMGGYNPRYDTLSGTSMAAPYVAAGAARRWGYKPLETNAEIGYELMNLTPFIQFDYPGDGSCWPMGEPDHPDLDIAAYLERGAIRVSVYDANTGIGLSGTTISVSKGATTLGSAVITPTTGIFFTPPVGYQTRIMNFTAYTEIINLPYVPWDQCTLKANKAGYTYGAQNIFQHTGCIAIPGIDLYIGRSAIPPKSSNFDAVLGWWWWYNDSGGPQVDIPDLDLYVVLPTIPNPLDSSQPANYFIGAAGYDYMQTEGDSSGGMTFFPFARWKRDGGGLDGILFEDTTISSRKAHGTLAANAALPYYPGSYGIIAFSGATIDHDGDSGTDPIPVMGTFLEPYLYIWKDGVIKKFVGMGNCSPNDLNCNTFNWYAATIQSGISGSPTYIEQNWGY